MSFFVVEVSLLKPMAKGKGGGGWCAHWKKRLKAKIATEYAKIHLLAGIMPMQPHLDCILHWFVCQYLLKIAPFNGNIICSGIMRVRQTQRFPQ